MPARTALYYNDDAYQEASPRGTARAGEQQGLMGRQVAGNAFLDSYLAHGTWTELVAVVPHRRVRDSLYVTCESHPSSRLRSRRLKFVELENFQATFAENPPADVIHFPCPPDARFAWCRESLREHAYALCGVTHTLCSTAGMDALCQMVTAPFEHYDRLICTSRAVIDTVQAVFGAYAEYFRERWGGDPHPHIQLEQFPLGVDVTKYRPATPGERARQRNLMQIDDDEFVVLFMGRLSHHAKAHPWVMYEALSEASRRTGRRVRLLLAGWASVPAVLDAFRDGAQQFAPNVHTTIVDGNRPDMRYSVWHAADLFTSLSDNIQETFGLVVVEAMASGLPVVGSDWDGYRDLVVDGDTGYLVQTRMVQDATTQLTAQLLLGEINYDHFLARTNQCVAVDAAMAAEAYVRLIEDESLRRRMSEAGRQRACERFAWPQIIGAYEALWQQQTDELANAKCRKPSTKARRGPSLYPAPEWSFRNYPSQWLAEHNLVSTAPGAEKRIARLLATPLTNYEAGQRCADVEVLKRLLAMARSSRTIQDLEIELLSTGGGSYSHSQCRATIAWLLKYDLLRVVERCQRCDASEGTVRNEVH